jgi:hypothetical protein
MVAFMRDQSQRAEICGFAPYEELTKLKSTVDEFPSLTMSDLGPVATFTWIAAGARRGVDRSQRCAQSSGGCLCRSW